MGTKRVEAFDVSREPQRLTIEGEPRALDGAEEKIERALQPPVGLRDALSLVRQSTGLRSAELAEALPCSVQNASNKLRRLYELGYLQRKEQSSPTGGAEFEYYVADAPSEAST